MSEAAYLDKLFAETRQAMLGASGRQPFPPRFIAAGARSMAGHLGMTEAQMQEMLPDAAFYQHFLPAALAADPSNFTEVATRLPESYTQVRDTLSAQEWRRVVVLVFHMSAVPLVSMLVNQAWIELRPGPRHALIAPRNLSWLQHESGRWANDAGDFIPADRTGLRRLISGLRDGSIDRMVTLVDGPQAPGTPGTRALTGISPSLGFRTGAIRFILSSGIPVLPLLHYWKADRLQLEWRPALPPSVPEGIDAVAGLIEELLRQHPEQWLNWTAARLRA